MPHTTGRCLSVLVLISVLLLTLVSVFAITPGAKAADAWKDMKGPNQGDAPRVVWDEANTTLYRATQMRGVFKLKNNQWTSLGGETQDKTIRSLALDERNPASTNLYVGTYGFGVGQGYGVWRCNTPDVTPTWSKISSPSDVGDLKIQSLYYESVTNILYIGIDGNQGVWRCTTPDGTPTWLKISSGADVGSLNIRSFAYDGGLTHRLYAGVTPASPDGGVWRCDNPDGAYAWTKISTSTDMRHETEALCFHHGKLYGALSGKGIWRCDNPEGAYVWDKISGQSNIGEADSYSLYYYDGTSDYLYAVGGDGAWRCSNPDAAGPTNSWTKFSPWDWNHRRVCTSMAFDYNSNEIWVGTASYGVYKVIYLDANVQWLNTVGGLSNDMVSDFYTDSAHNILYATSNSGFWRCRNPGTTQTWEQTDGPSGRIAYDSIHNIIYVGTWGSGIWRCTDPDLANSASWTKISTFDEGADALVGGIAYDPNHDVLYAGMYGGNPRPAGVWHCGNPRSSSSWSWSNISTSGDVGGLSTNDMAYDSTRNKIYTTCFTSGGAKAGIWRCDNPDGTFGWVKISTDSHLADGETYTIAFDQKRNLLYASLYQSGGWDGIHRCVAPDTSPVWEPLSGITISYYNDIVCDSMHNLVYVSTPHYGVFRGAAPDGATVWTSVYDKTEGQYQWMVLGTDGPGSNLYGGISQMGAWQAPFPGVVSCSPEKAGRGQTVNVNIVGSNTNFVNGASQATFSGSGITVLSTTVTDPRHARARIRLADDAALGARDVTVTTGAETADTLFGGFTVERAAPGVVSISPASGMTGTNPLNVTNLAGSNFYATPTVKLKKGSTDITATNVSVVSSTKITCKFNLSGAAPGSWNLYVQNPDGKNAIKNSAFTVNPAPAASSTWYLAEGTTAWGFSTYISIENPNPSALSANVTYMPTGAAARTETVTLPPSSQTTLTNDHLVGVLGGQTDFSTKVECTDRSKPLAVDRTMMWTGKGAPCPEAHCSVGVTSPAKTWYLPEGSSAWGFESWLLIQNPNAGVATCQVTYMIEGESPLTVSHTVPGNSRASFNMAKDAGAKDASIKVTSDVPVIPERAMYKNSRREGHDSIGTTTPASDFYLAEGTTAWGFTTYVLVQNPNPDAASVSITYMTPSGPQPQGSFTMAANSRKTIRVNDVTGMGNTDFSTQVHGTRPIIAERAMYWGAGTALGEACHDSIGMATPAMTFWLPDGEAGSSVETWTLVQNPNPSPVTVDITYLTPSGTGNITRTETIGANSRVTFGMQEHSHLTGRASILVKSKTSGKKIMCERSMYWNNKGAGTDTIGGYSD